LNAADDQRRREILKRMGEKELFVTEDGEKSAVDCADAGTIPDNEDMSRK
jgi:hypothetical protein